MADAKDIEHAFNLMFLAQRIYTDHEQREQRQHRARPHPDAFRVKRLAYGRRPHRRINAYAINAGSV